MTDYEPYIDLHEINLKVLNTNNLITEKNDRPTERLSRCKKKPEKQLKKEPHL
jgi:hypothetical protein